MSRPARGLLLLGGAALLLAVGGSGSSSPHSLRYFFTALSEPGPGLPWFIVVGYVDNQPIDRYDSITKRDVPKAPWMKKVVEFQADYWEEQSQVVQGSESVFRANLEILRERFNQKNSTGLHTWQLMYGCEVGPDRQPRMGHMQYAYDGEDFLAFDKETLTWTACGPQAEISKQKLDMQLDVSELYKAYLEETCMEWLQRYLCYGKETLQRREAPTGRVSRKRVDIDQETLICRLDGFYPKEIEVTWMKDGEDRKPETMSGGVVPNSDGTYHTWVSIEVDPEEKDRYRCHVGHDSLPEPLDLAWKEPAPNVMLVLVILNGVLAVLILPGVIFLLKKRKKKKGHEAASEKQQRNLLRLPVLLSWAHLNKGDKRPDSISSGCSTSSSTPLVTPQGV